METKELMFYFFILFFYGFTVKNTNWFQNLIMIIYEYNSFNVLFNFYEDEEDEEEEKEEPVTSSIVVKYEDKYWEEIHKIDCDYFFTDEELLLEEKQYNDEKDKFEKEKLEWETNLNILQTNIPTLLDNDNNIEEANKTKEELKDEIQKMEKFISENNEDKFLERARNHMIKIHLEKLKKCFVIEKTPLGNVAMYYNADRESFEYFSDNTIPYRFLEVVGRKYVITFQCLPLYIIMEEELKKFEKKLLEKQEKEDKQKEKQEEEQKKNTNTTVVAKKNVFAKFKSYNTEAGSGRVNKAPPPKNSIPRSKQQTSNAKVILKENANHYTYEGRFSNFNPLQKIERKQVDKKYGTSYAEFKKMLKK